MTHTLRSSILAGICIGIAGFGYLASPNIIGAVLFAFGLLAVVHFSYKLYTGTAGFIKDKNELLQLLLILVGNLVGCFIVAMMTYASPMSLQAAAQAILTARLNTGAFQCGVLAIGCGFIMTTAVNFGRQNRFLPLLFGVPLFIMCGFPHCIADAFYYMSVPSGFLYANMLDIIGLYVSIVIGNFIGCNLYRIILK
jgi:formate/nitrite transporter FocA (FNT family)